jgi:hypothetical protein
MQFVGKKTGDTVKCWGEGGGVGGLQDIYAALHLPPPPPKKGIISGIGDGV